MSPAPAGLPVSRTRQRRARAVSRNRVRKGVSLTNLSYKSLLHHRPVTLRRVAGVIEFPARPEHAARHEIEIARIGDGLVLVADGRAEYARAVIVVRPHDHVVVFLLL